MKVLMFCLTLALFLASCGPTVGTPSVSALTPIPGPAETVVTVPATSPPAAQTQEGVFKWGQPATWPDGLRVTVSDPSPYSPKADDYDPPSFTFDVVIENQGAVAVSYTFMMFEAQDATGVSYQATLSVGDGAMGSGDILPGRKVRGFIGFNTGATAPASVTLNDFSHLALWE